MDSICALHNKYSSIGIEPTSNVLYVYKTQITLNLQTTAIQTIPLPFWFVVGAVLVFLHGGEWGGLVHEGAHVIQGAKYVIRSDVLYKIPGHVRK